MPLNTQTFKPYVFAIVLPLNKIKRRKTYVDTNDFVEVTLFVTVEHAAAFLTTALCGTTRAT